VSKLSHEDQLHRLENYLRVLQQTKFFGKVTLDIQSGNILRTEKRESTRLEDMPNGVASGETQTSREQAEEETTEPEQAFQEGKAPSRR
jgi:hypothetical protein